MLPDIRVGELMLMYLQKHVQKHYVKNGRRRPNKP